MADQFIAEVIFPLVIAPDTKRPLQAQIRFACEEGYHPSITILNPLSKVEIDVISLVFGTACSFSSSDRNGLRTMRLDFFPLLSGQKEVTHVRSTSILAPHSKLLISFLDRDACASFVSAIKDALVQRAMLRYHYSAEMVAPSDDQSGTVMYTVKVSQASPAASSTINRRFTAFKELHASLVSLGIPVRKLPGKDWKAVVKSKKHDPGRLQAKAIKLGRFIDAICTHERTAKLPVVLEFLSLDSAAGQEVASAAMSKMKFHDSSSAAPRAAAGPHSSHSGAKAANVEGSSTSSSAAAAAASLQDGCEIQNVYVTSFTVLKDGSDAHSPEYVSYEIAVMFRCASAVDNQELHTKSSHKRFSDFRSLQKDLAEQKLAVPSLPGKAWLAVTHKAKFDANRLHIKQGNLSQFLVECMKSPAIVRNIKFLEFCGLGKGAAVGAKDKPRIEIDMLNAKKLRRAGKWAECYQLYLQCAEEGNSEAQAWVGHCLINAKGVPRDESRAVTYFKSSAESGLSMAQVKLGACYEQGIGVPKNPSEAVKWYRLSADQNNSAAQYSLGVCLFEGIGCSRDVDQAIRLLESSRDLGVDQAKVALQRIEELRAQ
jgi:TPR repeat protein